MSKLNLLMFITVTALALANASPGEKSKKYCRETHVAKSGRVRRIIGGEFAAPNEFSHMVAISYEIKRGKTWYCAGSLISDKYVLTLASCITSKIPKYVRLGDLDLNSESDDANAVDVKVVKLIVHPDYVETNIQHNIGLIELETKIEFNDYIRPACLNTEKASSGADSFIATGWGRTENGTRSSSLLKVSLDEIIGEECSKIYKTVNIKIDGQKYVCTNSKSKDACTGDAGGPLQKLNPDFISTYDIYGITSFGDAKCASGFPSVFTRVSYYVDWIESIVFNN